MAASGTYAERRARVEDYFDRTAAETWARLTSDDEEFGYRIYRFAQPLQPGAVGGERV